MIASSVPIGFLNTLFSQQIYEYPDANLSFRPHPVFIFFLYFNFALSIILAMKIIFSYTKDNSIIIRRCLSPSGEVTLPAFINNRPVTELAPYAFSRSELVMYDNAFIFDADDLSVRACSPDREAEIDRSEEVICERLLSISLPRTLLKVGRYCFYGCEKLSSISMYSTTIDLGFGMFTGCTGVRNLDMTVTEGVRSSLNDVLVNIRFPLKLTYREAYRENNSSGDLVSSTYPERVAPSDLSGDLLPECNNIGIGGIDSFEQTDREGALSPQSPGEKAPVKYRLIFPEYYENSKENTPARITVRDMQGSGYMYRNCFANTMFQIKRYDSLFSYAEALEPEETVCELALCRLETPCDLSEEAEEKYISYLKFHAKKFTELLIRHYESDEISMSRLKELASMDFVTEDYSSKMTEAAMELKNPEVLSVLMDLRHERFGLKEKDTEKERSPRKRRFSL